MLGTLVNVAAVIVGGGIGLLLKKGLNERLSDLVMKGLALCVMYVGISGALEGENTLIAILSIAVGALIGGLPDLDKYLNRLGEKLEQRFKKEGDDSSAFAQGFVAASLLFCVGAMSIVGSLQSGLTGDHTTIFTKSLLDFIAAIVLASSLGAGVLLSGAFVLVYQGGITLLAGTLSPLLSESTVNEMTCVGSLLIIGLALNMLGVTNLKLMNYVPAIFMPILLCLFM
ncbi:MAG: DUF554 domain-containing protein [Clostridiales bacterium]|nr:DUF554 domain-containing protein [Clostridiales bacterium]